MGSLTPLHVYRQQLETLLSDEVDRLSNNMSLGNLENFAEYKYFSGKIAGLRLALEYLVEADRMYREKVL